MDVSRTIDRIYADFAPALVSQARRILKNSDDAHDCVHDVLFRLWQRPQLFSPEKGTLRSFLFACVGNEARSRQRLAGRRQRILRASAADFAERTCDFDSHVDRLQLSRAIAALPPLQRQAITMHYLHDMRHSDIAEQLETPIGTIKTRIHQAKRRLRCSLA
ncbi:MAG TPA: sigma-70 family RNA polymerase sigma factor [Candidatus Baltobacteraceae bacterium]|nr:sigma-70 family RNA polymerase sigma factor [Candidatus Baltobacteraceae bacterium]